MPQKLTKDQAEKTITLTADEITLIWSSLLSMNKRDTYVPYQGGTDWDLVQESLKQKLHSIRDEPSPSGQGPR